MSKIVNLTFKQKALIRVNAGIALLNSLNPGWVKKIKMRDLDLGNGQTCVLGELYGSFDNGKSQLGLSNELTTALGFFVPDEENSNDEYDTLTDVWAKKIRKLKVR